MEGPLPWRTRLKRQLKCCGSSGKVHSEQQAENELNEEEDIDCDALENRMMRSLENEKQTIKNWHKVMMRVQMVNAFKLSMRLEDQPIDNDDPEE